MSLTHLEEEAIVRYDCRWSNQVDEMFIDDFCKVENAVFFGYTRDKFEKKFRKNIYGESVVVVVYMNDAPVAARALWRNDIRDVVSYQPCDTCVLEVCRGKGIFTTMTRKSMEMLPENSFVYNFPNPNSYPGYIKMGWNLNSEYVERLFSVRHYIREHEMPMDEKYAEWWLDQDAKYCYIKRKQQYFLLAYMGRGFCYKVIAEVSEKIARKYTRLVCGFVFYRSKKRTFYNKKLCPLRVVSTKNDTVLYIPPWKMDAI